ncbi:4285_t:CDS:2 [Entrophospora sp. SA101]|nr:4285_t:CDS:2 [Entrophospora sp. SA101]
MNTSEQTINMQEKKCKGIKVSLENIEAIGLQKRKFYLSII